MLTNYLLSLTAAICYEYDLRWPIDTTWFIMTHVILLKIRDVSLIGTISQSITYRSNDLKSTISMRKYDPFRN